MASTCKGVPVPPIYESCYSVMDEDLSLSLHILDQSEKELEMKFILFFYMELARLKEVERKKEKESEENRGKWDFRPFMERRVKRPLKVPLASLSEGEVS